MIRNSINRVQQFVKNQKPYMEIFLDLVIAILILVFIMNILSYFGNSDRQRLTFLGYKPVIVKSGSMEPEILINAFVLIKECNIEDLKINDIVAFFHENNMIAHKVIKIEDDGVKTKGVNNSVSDPFIVTKDMVFGKAIAHTNLTSYLLKINKKTWFLALILILSIAIFIKLLRKLFSITFTDKNTSR